MRIPPPIPQALIRNTIELHGPAGAGWLDRLPALFAESEERWSLEVGSPFPELSFNYVAPALRADGTAAVLKLTFPEDPGFRREAEALRLFDGQGAARLLELDSDCGAMLLERLEPGVPLTTARDDEEATSIAAGVLRQLWRPVPPRHPFPSVSDWAQGFDRLRRDFGGGTGPMPAAMVEKAEALFADLLASQGETALLHGDLHHQNVLAARREPWLAIDPKGVVGEPAYDAAALLHNPTELLDAPRPGKVLERRVDLLSEELGLERARVRNWGIAQAVLAAYWGLEDGGRVWGEALVFAELLSASRT
jgi:streptomycin 6-kinase